MSLTAIHDRNGAAVSPMRTTTRNAADVLVTNTDNDLAGITVTAATTPSRRPKRAGRRRSDQAQHHADGERDDCGQLGSSAEGRSSGSLVFTSANWNVAQTVTVTGADDAVVDSRRTRLWRRLSTDANWHARCGRRAGDEQRQRRGRDHGDGGDDAVATSEAGGTATFTVVLNTQPTANVTLRSARATRPKGRSSRRAWSLRARTGTWRSR
jgi:hypothetical protein